MGKLGRAKQAAVLIAVTIGLSLSGLMGNVAVALTISNTTLVSVSPTGDPANNNGAILPILTPNGRYILFNSDASNLVSEADGQHTQAYLKDMQSGSTELISRSSDGTIANNDSHVTDVSQDGRYVLFYSAATNLVPGIEPAFPTAYLYLRDQQLHTTTAIAPVSNAGVIAHPNMDDAASTIVYTEPNESSTLTVFVLNRASGVATAIGETAIDAAYVSADGSNVVFLANRQTASGDELYDLVKYTLATGASTTLLTQLPLSNYRMSPDNSRTAYTVRDASNTFGLRLLNIDTNTEVQTITPAMAGSPYAISFSGDNKYFSYMEHTADNSGPSFGKLQVENLATGQKVVALADGHRLTGAMLNQDGTKFVFANNATDRQVYLASLTEDTTPPTISSPSINPPVMLFTHNATISATTADTGSGVAHGEYYIDTDPGHGATLPYANGKVSGLATISGLTPGLHRVYIRAVDNAGNWSAPVSAQFIYVNFN